MTSDQSPGEPLRMTPGPTEIPHAVRERMAQRAPNPDIEPAFFERYRALTANLETVFGTDGVVILGGEGILGLEAAVASILEPGASDRVLCLSNGLYGDGFADFVELYGGTPELVRSPAEKPFDLAALESTLEAEAFLAATVVHCETPTGTLNHLEPVLELLEAHDVLRIVDAVSSLGGTAVPAEKIDICLGASQKCFSAPPGLTVASVSDRAWERIEATETPSFYANLEPWKDALDEEWFPYTHLASNVLALEAAIELLLEEGLEAVFARGGPRVGFRASRGRCGAVSQAGSRVWPLNGCRGAGAGVANGDGAFGSRRSDDDTTPAARGAQHPACNRSW